MQNKKQAFTLVELIVVITILAILGTIAFISMQSYSKSSRDSVRIGDMSKIRNSLELFQINAGKYPLTTNGTIITYSGSEAWTQGIFGDDTFKNVERLDKIPTDPLTKKEYTYSTTNTRQEYELAGIMEGDEISLNSSLANKTFAGGKLATLRITGNYNGKLLKVLKGTTTYVLAIPSLITSSGASLEYIINNNLLAYNGYKNLPFEYNNTSYDILGSFGILLVNTGSLVVYSGLISDLLDSTNSTYRQNLVINLKNAYTGTTIVNVVGINELIKVDTNNTGAVELLASSIINNDLGGNLKLTTVTPVEVTSIPRVESVEINGDYLTRGNLIGVNNSKTFILSTWIKTKINNDNGYLFHFTGDIGYDSYLQFSNNNIRYTFSNSILGGASDIYGGEQLLENNFTVGQWHHILMSVNVETDTVQVYVDDVDNLYSGFGTRVQNGDINFSSTVVEIGQGGWLPNMEIAEFYFAPGEYLDFSQESNRRKFIRSDGYPTGNLIDSTGLTPAMYLANEYSIFHQNLGTGGDFIVNGTLNAGLDSPSD